MQTLLTGQPPVVSPQSLRTLKTIVKEMTAIPKALSGSENMEPSHRSSTPPLTVTETSEALSKQYGELHLRLCNYD